jgi:hypothetical protein
LDDLITLLLVYAIQVFRRKSLHPALAGLEEIDNAGDALRKWAGQSCSCQLGNPGRTLHSGQLMILAQVAKKSAEFDIRLSHPLRLIWCCPWLRNWCKPLSRGGGPDAYNQNDIFFVSYDQFPFCAGVNGSTVRERVATIFYMGSSMQKLCSSPNPETRPAPSRSPERQHYPGTVLYHYLRLHPDRRGVLRRFGLSSKNHDLVCMLKTRIITSLFGADHPGGKLLSTFHINVIGFSPWSKA